MAAVSIGTSGEGYTSGSKPDVVVRALHRNPVTAPATTNWLKRVSVVFGTPTAGSEGRPAGNTMVPTSEVIEDWGRLLIFVGGRDVTSFRSVATEIQSISWQRFGTYEACELGFDGITNLDKPGTGSLTWLREDAPVRIERQRPNGNRSTLWRGYVNSMRIGERGTGLTLTAHGILLDGSFRVALPPVRSKQLESRKDAGHRIARALNSARGRWGYCRPVNIGVDTTKAGQSEDVTSYVRSLLNLAIDDNGHGWTVYVNDEGKPRIVRARSIPGKQTHTIVSGQDGVDDDLMVDTTAGITAIYGRGTTVGGAAWRNTLYPVSSGTKPRYPLDDPDALMGPDLLNKGTVTGDGVSTLQSRLNALGQDVTVNGVYNEATAAAVANLQKKYGMKVTGVVNIKFWSKIWKQRDAGKGAWVAPLAITNETKERNWSIYGKDLGRNPAYNPRARKLERFIDFAAGVTLAQAKRIAAAIITRDGEQPIEGTVTLSVCPQESARWDIMPGDTLRIRGRWGESSRDYIVHRVEWSFSDAPTVALTVSTRDMDAGLLLAELNRQPREVVTTQTRYPAITEGTTADTGTPPTLTTSDGVRLISKVKTLSANKTLTASDAEGLFLLSSIGGAFEVRMPSDADADLPLGTQFHFVWTNGSAANAPVLAAVSPVALRSMNGTKFQQQWAPATVVKVDKNEWVISGAMTAV